MSNDFQINTALQMGNFNNSISEFNRAFSKVNNASLNQTVDGTNFDEIFNSISKNPLQGSAQFSIDTLDSAKSAPPAKNAIGKIGTSVLGALAEISEINNKADKDFETFASGGNISVHDVMISTQKSQLAMSMAIQLRNQALNAYNELKNMSM